MTQHNHGSHTPSRKLIRREHANGTGRGKTVRTRPPRPKGNNRDEWAAYWQAQGWSWRTEPEIPDARQGELARCRITPVEIEKGIYPFGDMNLDRADVEWLLATHENERGPVLWSDEKQQVRRGLDLRGAVLCDHGNKPVDLRNLPLTCLRGALTLAESSAISEELCIKGLIHLERADLRGAKLERASLSGARLEEADLSEARLEGADLSRAHLKRADLSGAHLKRADLSRAHLKGVDLSRAHLEGTDLRWAHLEGANLHGAHLEGTDLRWAYLVEADLSGAHVEGANLTRVTLSKEDGIGPCLVDVQWSNINLAVARWSQVILLGEEDTARQKDDADGDKKKRERCIDEYQEATRANRQLAVALLGQGLNEDAVRFAYRANALQRKVLWYQIVVSQVQRNAKKATAWQEALKKRFVALLQQVQRIGSYSFSLFLDVIAGYGYKPGRTVGWYFFVVFGFALCYALFGHLPFWPDALVYSLTSFHGRGFLPNLNGQVVTLHFPLVVMAAFEAVIGLLIEVSFIATFTQRFFGK